MAHKVYRTNVSRQFLLTGLIITFGALLQANAQFIDQSIPSYKVLIDVHVVDEGIAYVVGDSGALYKTTTEPP